MIINKCTTPICSPTFGARHTLPAEPKSLLYFNQNLPRNSHLSRTTFMAKTSKICAFVLRFLAMATALSAAIVMATSREHTTVFNMPVVAKYQYMPAFEFFLIANAIGSTYSLLVLFLSHKSLLRRLVVALDVVVAMLLTAAIAAAGAVGYVGKKGNTHAGWLPICDQLSKFCNHVSGALILGCFGALLYVFLLLHSLQTVLSPLLL